MNDVYSDDIQQQYSDKEYLMQSYTSGYVDVLHRINDCASNEACELDDWKNDSKQNLHNDVFDFLQPLIFGDNQVLNQWNCIKI